MKIVAKPISWKEQSGDYEAIMVGVNTIIRDNPQLNCKEHAI